METENQLRRGCVLAVALCGMIMRQELWPDIDPESLKEFQESVESTRRFCTEAIRRYDVQPK